MERLIVQTHIARGRDGVTLSDTEISFMMPRQVNTMSATINNPPHNLKIVPLTIEGTLKSVAVINTQPLLVTIKAVADLREYTLYRATTDAVVFHIDEKMTRVLHGIDPLVPIEYQLYLENDSYSNIATHYSY